MNVDRELLADYLAGALDGTPTQEEVARRVATDDRWAAAASELATAHSEVTTRLSAFAAQLDAPGHPPMPDDVAARLTAALDTAALDTADAGGAPDISGPADAAGAAGPGATDTGVPRADASPAPRARRGGSTPAGSTHPTASRAPSGRGGPAGSHPRSAPAGPSGPAAPSGPQRPRRPGWRRPRLVAAAGVLLLVLAGGGAIALTDRLGGAGDPAGTLAQSEPSPTPDRGPGPFSPRVDTLPGEEREHPGPSAGPDGADPGGPRPPVLLASGVDYDPRRLATGPAGPTSGDSPMAEVPRPEDGGPEAGGPDAGGPDVGDPEPGDPGGPAAPGAPPAGLPAELRELWHDQQLFTACLDAVVAALSPGTLGPDGAGPDGVTVEAADFARFRGEPALVVWATVGDGDGRVLVAGPACGAGGAGADELYSAPVPG